MVELFRGKRVLFITTKNIDYIRNSQEIRFLNEYASDVKLVFSDKKGYLKRLPDIYHKLRNSNIDNVDIVFAGFAPQLLLPFFRKWKDKTIVVDFFISIYDTLVNDRKKLIKRGLAARFCHWLDSATLEKANVIVADTEADARFFTEEFIGTEKAINGIDPRFFVWYLEADRETYYTRTQNKPQCLKEKYVVLYFGSILPLQGVNVVLDAVKALRNEKRIFFQIIGPIPRKYHKPIQENVEYIEWLSQRELAEYIANADLCLAGHFSGTIDKAKRTIAGKTYIYQSMEKAMILGENPANRELFSEDSSTFFVEMGNAQNLAKKIMEIYRKNERF